ncbi:MAG: phosphoribosylformylglycinamidine synthase [Bacteroidales bacterium]|nr:phosphoribosylformylglycinamidine synthase [Bacteroidales bacterium]
MILFFKNKSTIYVVESPVALTEQDQQKLVWLFGNAQALDSTEVKGHFIGPRKEMITPWSTNAVEITQNMGIEGITRIEEFKKAKPEAAQYDPMLKVLYEDIDQNIFFIDKKPDPILHLDDIAAFNEQEGLALSADEVEYLEQVSQRIGRKLTDSEVYGFAQVNSEHCRHKIFNGSFIIDGVEKENTLFSLIKKTAKENPNRIVSAYSDNVAFVLGPKAEQFAPETQDKSDYFSIKNVDTVISLKAETHNFPTTVEPFNGAATGGGGEIRDRMAGGKASMPIAGTAVYMTSYPRTESARAWEQKTQARPWLYQTPEQILIKASDGASDFGNKFGQPLICGSLLTFEHFENEKKYGYDKVIMLAGGVGYANKVDALKDKPEPGDVVVVLGGDNYRIGMGGGAVSSVATGQFNNSIELNAVQRSNPEMQKRVANAIRAMAERGINPIVSIHDHGAGGHLNSLSELVEEIGGKIDVNKLPVGDPTLSFKEIVGNESQERMGLIMKKEDVDILQRVADRERAPMYVVGETTGDHRFVIEDSKGDVNPIDMDMVDMFGKPPKTILIDETIHEEFDAIRIDPEHMQNYVEDLLQLEAVACKDWLTNKVDRSVTGKIAMQQCAGPLQLPLNNLGVVSIDYRGEKGIATSIGHAPVSALIDPGAGSRLSVAEALTNLVWAPLYDQLKGVSLSANWMWPSKNPGEDARLYKAVEEMSAFACELGINIPTGKDSLSMTQKYENDVVYSPGTVIVSTVGEVTDVKKAVGPVLKNVEGSSLLYINFSQDEFKVGGSSFAQILNSLGAETPTVKDSEFFKNAFNAVQQLIEDGKILAGHDVASGGLITTLLEMTFAVNDLGLDVDLTSLESDRTIGRIIFSENPGIVFQVANAEEIIEELKNKGVEAFNIGSITDNRKVNIAKDECEYTFDIDTLRDIWFKSSYLLDRNQSGEKLALDRYHNYKKQERVYEFPKHFTGKFEQWGISPDRREKSGVKAAIIREKGVNGDREMAYSMYLAGFDVKDVHMTDLISGRETLEDVNFIVFVGGFSNSDVLGSAKGWAGAFLYNEKANQALKNFYNREDTLSLGVCNGCQVVVELGMIYPDHEEKPTMLHNESGKFESGFVTVDIQENNSIMLNTLAGSKLGIWCAHGEGKFKLPYKEEQYQIPMKYSYKAYPANPNGSDYATAAIVSEDGRHLAMMPHLERSIFSWNWAHYPTDRKATDEVTPWIEAFVNAKNWIQNKTSK